MKYENILAKRTQGLSPSPIRKLAPLMRLPGMISFGGGYPNPDTFAFESLNVGFRSRKNLSLTGNAVDLACQYGPTDSLPSLKPLLLSWHKYKDNVTLDNDQIQVLNGAQEGLHIMGYLFLEPGDAVAISEPAYPGALGAFRAFTDAFISIPVDADGTVTSALEEILRTRMAKHQPMPKFLYESPNGHNPAGVALSLERRKHLLDIASQYDLLILEDDPYELIQLEDRSPMPTLQSLDTESRVVRLDSFSKIFAPGLRIGYASGPAELIHLFQLYKQTTNLHTSAMVQSLLAGYMTEHSNDEFMELIRENCMFYRKNREVMARAARSYLPKSVTFNIPTEGMFIWFELPQSYNAQRMIDEDGLDLGVLMVPGPAFSATGGLSNCLRASFSMVSPEQIEEGMKRFAEMCKREENRD